MNQESCIKCNKVFVKKDGYYDEEDNFICKPCFQKHRAKGNGICCECGDRYYPLRKMKDDYSGKPVCLEHYSELYEHTEEEAEGWNDLIEKVNKD